MNNSTIVFLINDSVRAIKATYEERGKEEIFKTFDPDIAVDDLVVVESTTRHDMTVVKVTEVDVDLDFDTTEKVKWIVQRIDKPGFMQVLANEAKAIDTVKSAERRRQKAELRANLMKDHEGEFDKLALSDHSDDPVTE